MAVLKNLKDETLECSKHFLEIRKKEPEVSIKEIAKRFGIDRRTIYSSVVPYLANELNMEVTEFREKYLPRPYSEHPVKENILKRKEANYQEEYNRLFSAVEKEIEIIKENIKKCLGGTL